MCEAHDSIFGGHNATQKTYLMNITQNVWRINTLKNNSCGIDSKLMTSTDSWQENQTQCQNFASTGLQSQDFSHWDTPQLPQLYRHPHPFQPNNHNQLRNHLQTQARVAPHLILCPTFECLALDQKLASLPLQPQVSQILQGLLLPEPLHRLRTQAQEIFDSEWKLITRIYILEHCYLVTNNARNDVLERAPQFKNQSQK